MKLGLAFLLVGLALMAAPLGHSADPRLIGTVGPGFTMSLEDASGADVRTLVAGRYELLVRDLSDEHNFVLGKKSTGERPAQTTVEFVGEQTFIVDLTPGLWVYACSPHFQTMNGQLTVTAPPTTAPKRLAARVTATRVSLTPTRATPGAYVLSVDDRSPTRGFRIVGPGLDRRTGASYVGKKSWTLRLRAGTYRFGDQRKLTGRLVVA